MTYSMTLDREEFSAKRREAQSSIEAALAPVVREALDRETDTSGWDELLDAVYAQYAEQYAVEAGEGPVPEPHIGPDPWRDELRSTLRKTHRPPTEATVERISIWLATWVLSAATMQASTNDPEELFLEWVTMHDKDVRTSHRRTDGQVRPEGDSFDVDGVPMRYPGDHLAPIELWINCRCTLRPVLASETLVASSESEVKNKSTVVVGLPAKDHAVHSVGEEQKHVTLAFLGEHDNPEPIHAAVQRIASDTQPFDAAVSGNARLGPDKAKVLLVEAPEIQGLRNRLMDDPDVNAGVSASDAHPHFVPHMTLGYDESTPETADFDTIPIDRLAVWHRDEQTEYALGGAVDPETETETPDQPTETPAEETSADFAAVPWHGVLAPEGINSGDGRRFADNSLTFRPLPLPLTWQKVSDDGHKGNVTVAKIESIQRVGNEMRATGHFLSNVEADEVVGLIAEFGKFGVSVDADDATFELADDDEVVEFTQARISSACIVPIPAFAEAWAALGEAPEGFLDGEDPEIVGEPDEALTAALVTAGRGPGWITNPADTKRLHDYWTKPGHEGYAKVNWGVPGDFNRCRIEVGEEIGENSPDKLRFINQICAQWHHDALGYWPGHPTSGETAQFAGEKMELEDTTMESVNLVAGGFKRAPAEWFQNPNLTEPTPLTVTDEGRVFGHIAAWTSCHIGYEDMCMAPPHSSSDYSYFLGGQVALDNGERANTGILSIGGGHAGPRLSARAAMAHYDSTSAAVADVTCGEDEHGIWFSGWVRPGASDEMVTALMASKLSGDWRTVQGEMELVAALAVNVPGFGINRPRVAASSQGQLSLVASGVVNKPERDKPTGIDYDLLAEKVAAQIANRESRKQRMAALAARVNRSND